MERFNKMSKILENNGVKFEVISGMRIKLENGSVRNIEDVAFELMMKKKKFIGRTSAGNWFRV